VSAVDWITVGLAIASIPALILVIRTGNAARHSEDDARAYFDEHGRWPDEPEDQG
jgi:hypothetical protein